jgi:hypothetical protein
MYSSASVVRPRRSSISRTLRPANGSDSVTASQAIAAAADQDRGFVFTDFYHLPGFDYTTLEAHDATVASGAMSQLLLWIGLLEVISTISIDQMLRGSGREPGDFGFDPIGFGSDPVKLKELQMKELANGRLAMFAFGGVVTQSVLTGNSFPYLFGDAETFGSGGNFAWNVVVTASMP